MTAVPTTTAPTSAPTQAAAPTKTARSGPLPARPRRAVVQRPPSPRSAARSLRRSVPITTGRVWRRDQLPGPVRTSAGVPWSESLVSLLIVVLLFVPVAVWTGFSPAVAVAAAVAVCVASYLLWARRVLVGERYVAVRQAGRYHVATVDHVRHLELRPSAHGGVLCVHTDDGRCMRLRRAEVSRPDVNAALRALAGLPECTRDSRVEDLLDMEHDASRIRHQYLADARS